LNLLLIALHLSHMPDPRASHVRRWRAAGPIVLDVFKALADAGQVPPAPGCIPGAIATAPDLMALPFPASDPQHGDGNVLDDDALAAAVLSLGITAASNVVCYSSYASSGSQYGPIAAARMVWILMWVTRPVPQPQPSFATQSGGCAAAIHPLPYFFFRAFLSTDSTPVATERCFLEHSSAFHNVVGSQQSTVGALWV
jgi:hypothetical protein